MLGNSLTGPIPRAISMLTALTYVLLCYRLVVTAAVTFEVVLVDRVVWCAKHFIMSYFSFLSYT